MMVDGRWSMGRTLLELGRLAISCVVLLLVSQASVADNSRANPNGVRKLGLLRLESDQPISVGEVFVSELLTCIVTLSSDQNASSIESVKPSCSCVTVELSEPSKADGRILRDLIFAVKRDATGPFQSKVTVVFKDGIKRDILISGEVKPILVVSPSVINLQESKEPSLITIKFTPDKVDLSAATLSLSDDRFVLSQIERERDALHFRVGMSPDCSLPKLFSTRECCVFIHVDGRLLTVSLDVKHKARQTLVPSTVFADGEGTKPVRLYLVGSKNSTLRSTGHARIRSEERGTVALGHFAVRSEVSGAFEFKKLERNCQNNCTALVEFEVADAQNNGKEWILAGEIVICFSN